MSCRIFRRRFAASLKQSLTVEGSLRLHELERGTEVTPSWRLETIGSKGQTVVEERHRARSV